MLKEVEIDEMIQGPQCWNPQKDTYPGVLWASPTMEMGFTPVIGGMGNTPWIHFIKRTECHAHNGIPNTAPKMKAATALGLHFSMLVTSLRRCVTLGTESFVIKLN